jgi:hypothetical protein
VAKRKKQAKRRVAPASAIGKSVGPVTLAEAKAMVSAPGSARTARRARQITATPGTVALERRKLNLAVRDENRRRTAEYKAALKIMKERGVADPKQPARRRVMAVAKVTRPLQIFAEGDSWFDYPAPFFGGGIIPRLEKLLGVPILSLAKAGDEVRFMLGVEERKLIIKHLTKGCPAGGPWDAMMFSGGGNDIVHNPMALWVRDFDSAIPISDHIHSGRFDAALALVRAGYEDLIDLRDRLSPNTKLIFHAYDFAIPDGRGICHLGPWLKPTFDLRRFPAQSQAAQVVKTMLERFAAMLSTLAGARQDVTFINGQGTLAPSSNSWHNELHPSKKGFDQFAQLFRTHLQQLFPGRVL